MAGTEAPGIEKEIQRFVFERTGERVRLNLGEEGQVAVECLARHGSTVLGILWVRVLQHPNNYPVQHFPYRRLYRAGGKHLVSLRVDSVTVNVCLATGTISVLGRLALDWFVLRFSGLLAGYTACNTDAGSKQLKDPFDAQQRGLIKTARQQMLQKHLKDWPDIVVKEDMDVVNGLKQQKEMVDESLVRYVHSYGVEVLPRPPLLGEKPNAEYYLENLLPPEALKTCLENWREGRMTDGASLYAAWTSLLCRWFADPDTKVFIVTPALDAAVLTRLCHIVLNHRLTASLEMLATPLQSRCGLLADVRRQTMESLPVQDRVMAESKVYESMIFPRSRFQAKFIAGLRGDSAEVLLTSADAEASHFQEGRSSMAVYQTLTASEFDSRLLAPILSSEK